jgi:hypothetical protein
MGVNIENIPGEAGCRKDTNGEPFTRLMATPFGELSGTEGAYGDPRVIAQELVSVQPEIARPQRESPKPTLHSMSGELARSSKAKPWKKSWINK